MRDVVIYDPQPLQNDYVTNLYFKSFLSFMSDRSKPASLVESGLLEIRNKNIILNANYLTPETIVKLKENGNSIYSFDINDSSWLSGEYREAEEAKLIDAIFKVSGLQDTYSSKEIHIDENLNYSTVDRKFELSENSGRIYNELREQNKLFSLPYANTNAIDSPAANTPWEQRTKQCLIRGGNHYLRYHLFLSLLKINLIDPKSGFLTNDYFLRSMVDQFRYCDSCIQEKETKGKVSWEHFKAKRVECAPDELLYEQLNISTVWNNRCPSRFYWLAEKFEKTYGNINRDILETALNDKMCNVEELNSRIGGSIMYGDYKWIFSIYAPPRFWEAAQCRTINLVPERTKDQTHFPAIRENEHYLSYKEDFSNIDELANITKEQYEYITNNCLELYNTFIKGTDYAISTRVLQHIFDIISNCEGQ